MPEKTPRAPLPALAIALSPFTWQYGRPDLFDSYRCGSCCRQGAIWRTRLSWPLQRRTSTDSSRAAT